MTTNRHRSARRDDGMTLIEVVVTVAVIGLVAAVVATSIVVILRSEDGVVASTAESHDTRQVVSYLPLDIESGPRRASAYRATIGGAPGDDGTGCDETGNENVLRIDVTDRRLDQVDKRIAYRLVTTAAEARLDRYECVLDTSVTPAVWVTETVVNVADYLNPTAAPIAQSELFLVNPAETDPDRQIVSRVELTYVQRGDVESIVAAPREESQLSSDGICTQEPLAAAQNMATFFELDVTLNDSDVKGALYVGGTLTFNGANDVAQANPPVPTPPVPADTGLLAGSIDWSGSTGVLSVKPHYGVVIEDGLYFRTAGNSLIESSSASTPPEIDIGASASDTAGSGTPIVTASEAFAKLRACSDRLAELPGSCDNGNCATHVGTNGSSDWSTLKIDLTPGLTNAMNITESQLLALQPHRIEFFPTDSPGPNSPLIINVSSTVGGTVSFEPPDIQAAGTAPRYILWNFPNADQVNILDGDRLYGTVLAPYADVTSDEDIEGGVIARSFVINNSTLHDVRYFQGVIGW